MIHQAVSVWQRLVALVRGRRIAEDVENEIAFHIVMRREQLEHDGATPAEAERLARRQFGNVTRLREDTQEMWTFPLFEGLLQDVRFACRTLRRARGFTIAAMATMALGIGASVGLFAVVNAVLLQPLPFADQDRLVLMWERNDSNSNPHIEVSLPNSAKNSRMKSGSDVGNGSLESITRKRSQIHVWEATG